MLFWVLVILVLFIALDQHQCQPLDDLKEFVEVDAVKLSVLVFAE